MVAWLTSVALGSVILFAILIITDRFASLAPPARQAGKTTAKFAIVLFFASVFLPAGYGAEIFGTMSTGQMIGLWSSPNAPMIAIFTAFGYVLTPLGWTIVHSGFRPPPRTAYLLAAVAAWLSLLAAIYFISKNGILIDRFLDKSKIPAFGSISWLVAALLLAVVWSVSAWRPKEEPNPANAPV